MIIACQVSENLRASVLGKEGAGGAAWQDSEAQQEILIEYGDGVKDLLALP